MEAEVVDPEEEKTAHYDYNAVRDKLKALDPEALAAAEAMFDDEDDEPATVMASQEPATVMAAPARRAPVVKNAIPGIRRSQPEPIAPPPESHPGTESLMDDDEDLATAIVGDDDVDRMRAAMDAKIAAAMGPPPADDDFIEDEPTRVASPAQTESAMQIVAEREAHLRVARSAGPPPIATPSVPGAAPTPGSGALPAPTPTPAAVPAAPRPGPGTPLTDAESQDLVQLLDQQRKKDTFMYVLAALLFAIGIGVWVLSQ